MSDFSHTQVLIFFGALIALSVLLIVVARKRGESPGQLLHDIEQGIVKIVHPDGTAITVTASTPAAAANAANAIVKAPSDTARLAAAIAEDRIRQRRSTDVPAIFPAAPATAPVPAVVAPPADAAGTTIAPAPPVITTEGVAMEARNPFDIGKDVVAWGLPQCDNWGKPIEGEAGALTKIDGGINASIEVCGLITNYVCANPSFTLDDAGFTAAYWKIKPVPVATHPNPPLPLTPAIQADLLVYQSKCQHECDKIGYLKLHGDLQNFLATNGLITALWYQTADYATTSGTYDTETKTPVMSPRVWEV